MGYADCRVMTAAILPLVILIASTGWSQDVPILDKEVRLACGGSHDMAGHGNSNMAGTSTPRETGTQKFMEKPEEHIENMESKGVRVDTAPTAAQPSGQGHAHP